MQQIHLQLPQHCKPTSSAAMDCLQKLKKDSPSTLTHMLPHSYSTLLLLLCYQYTAEIHIINPVIVLSLTNPDQFHLCKQAMGLVVFQRGLGGIGGDGTLNQNEAIGGWWSSMMMLYIEVRPNPVQPLLHQTRNRTSVPTKIALCFSAAMINGLLLFFCL